MHLRVLTYNIHKCIGGLDRRYDLSRIIETIRHYAPDIVLLQEAASSEDAQQSDMIGERLGYRHRAYFPCVNRRKKGWHGNAILSRYPIIESDHIDLSVPLKKRRSALHARIRLRSASGKSLTLHVYNLHLGLSGMERKFQLKRFLQRSPFAHLHQRAPILVGGDFNDVWGTLGKKILAPAGLRGAPRRIFTFPAYAPIRALDAFYVRGDLEITHLQRSSLNLARRASDHLPLIADCHLTALSRPPRN